MSVTVQMLVDKVKLDVIYGTQELLQKDIATADISRPGLEMTGYFDYYAPERIQSVSYTHLCNLQFSRSFIFF